MQHAVRDVEFPEVPAEIYRDLLKGVDRVTADKGVPAASFVIYTRNGHDAVQPIGELTHDKVVDRFLRHAIELGLNDANVAAIERVLATNKTGKSTIIMTSFDQPDPDAHTKAEQFAAMVQKKYEGVSVVMNYGLPYHVIEADGRASGARQFAAYCRILESDSDTPVMHALRGGYNAAGKALRVVYDPDFAATSVARRVWKAEGVPAQRQGGSIPDSQERRWIEENYTGVPLPRELPVRPYDINLGRVFQPEGVLSAHTLRLVK